MRWLPLVLMLSGCDLAWQRDAGDEQPERGPQMVRGDAGVGTSSDAAIDAAVPQIDAPLVTADLRVQLTDTPVHVAATAAFDFRVDVANAGPGSAERAQLTVQLPPQATNIMIAGLGWACAMMGSTATCTATQLDPAIQRPLYVSARAPSAAGTYSLVATVTSATAEPFPPDNGAAASFVVGSSGTFAAQVAYATGDYPIAVATADFNADGRADIAVANNRNQGTYINNLGSVSTLFGTSNGTLQAMSTYSVGYGPQAIVAGNFGNASGGDLVTANLAQGMGGNATFLRHSGGGSFWAPATIGACCSPQHLAAGHLDTDGNLDLVVANYNEVQVFRGTGIMAGAFSVPVSYSLPGSPLTVSVGDMNRDGKLDVVAAYSIYMQPNNIAVMLGNGDGTLQAAVLYDTTKGLSRAALADFTGDGILDVVAASVNNHEISLMRGTGTGALLPATHVSIGRVPVSIVAGDFNGDAKADVAVTNFDDNTLTVRLGNGDGTFQTATSYATQVAPVDVASADVDGDGRPDLVVANAGSDTVSLLLAQP